VEERMATPAQLAESIDKRLELIAETLGDVRDYLKQLNSTLTTIQGVLEQIQRNTSHSRLERANPDQPF
jgi:prefoldin subunit 5